MNTADVGPSAKNKWVAIDLLKMYIMSKLWTPLWMR